MRRAVLALLFTLAGIAGCATTQTVASAGSPVAAPAQYQPTIAPSVEGEWSTRLRTPEEFKGAWRDGNNWTFHPGGQMSETGFPVLAEERWTQEGARVVFYSAENVWTGQLSADGNTLTGSSDNGYDFVLTRLTAGPGV
jgi:hypothetical protein